MPRRDDDDDLEPEEEDEDLDEEEEYDDYKSGGRKRSRSQFIDDVAEEDEEEEDEDDDDDEDFDGGGGGGRRGGRGGGHKAKKRSSGSQFFDLEAAVDSDEDEEEEDGEDDFIEDGGADLPDEEDARRMHRRPLLREDDQEDVEALERSIQARYARSSHTEYDEETTDVEQQALLPSVRDPKLWMVKCAIGHEREVAVCLMQKCIDKGAELQIRSAIALDHLKNYIYIEADKEAHVREACKGMRNIFTGSKILLVPIKEMTDVLAVESKAIELSRDTWVRMKIGTYKGDLAKVVDVDNVRQRVTVKLIPRIDLQALANKLEGREVPKKKTFTPPPRFMNVDEAREMHIRVERRRDPMTGDYFENINGMMFKDGFLYKTVSMKSISTQSIQPSFDELEKFRQPGENGDGDMASLSTLFANRKKGHFMKGDRVIIVKGDLKNLKGVVEKVEEDTVHIKPYDEGLPKTLAVSEKELCKYFEPGNHVKVVSGATEGATGMVLTVEYKYPLNPPSYTPLLSKTPLSNPSSFLFVNQSMEFWGVEVKSGESLSVSPEEGRLIHVSQVALGEVKNIKGAQYVPIRMKIDDKKYIIGSLSAESRPHLTFDLVFEKEFELSHDWKDGSVFFCGYTADNPDQEEFGPEDFSDEDEDEEEDLILENGKVVPDVQVANPTKSKDAAKKPVSATKPKVTLVDPKKEESDEEEDSDDSDEELNDDSDDSDSSGDSDDDMSEDEETPKKAEPSKKRPSESATKTPVPAKKAKSNTPQKTDGKKGSGHKATPHPSKQAVKKTVETPKSSGQVSCKSCSKTFNSEKGLESHSKAKHGGK